MAVPARAGAVIVGREQSAMTGTRAEHRQKPRRDADRADAFGLALAGEVVVAADGDRQRLESVVAVPMSKYWAVENQSSVMPRPGERFHRIVEPVGVRVRERSQQERRWPR